MKHASQKKTKDSRFTIHDSRKVSGFTLVETLIAISVLLLAIAGPLTIAARGLTSAAFARDQIAAYYLAQEAMELIRNQRDNNALSLIPGWTNGLEACFTSASGCQVDARAPVFLPCPTESCPPLNRDQVTGFYSYDTGVGMAQSPFTRTISMISVSENEFTVSVRISWRNGPIAKDFTVQDNFLNWQ